MRVKTIAIGLAAALCCQTASAQEASTSGKLWALSPEATATQAQSDLNALLTPAERYPRGFEGVLYRHGVQEVSFVTPAFNADFPGLCARDTLTMRYAATSPIVGNENANEVRVRPYGIETARQYRFIRPPSLMMWGHSNAIRFNSECSALTGQQIDWFWVASGSPFDAVEAWLAFLAAADAVRDHKLKPGKCELEAEGSAEDCADHLGALLDFGHVTGVVKDLVDGRKRYQLFLGGFYITIGTRRPNTDLLYTPKPEDIVSIDIEPKSLIMD